MCDMDIQSIVTIFLNFVILQMVDADGWFEIQPNFFQTFHRTLLNGQCCEQREVGKKYFFRNVEENYPITPPCKRGCNFQLEICIRDGESRTLKNGEFKTDYFRFRHCNILRFFSGELGTDDIIVYNVTRGIYEENTMNKRMMQLRDTEFANVTRKKNTVFRIRLDSSRFTRKKSPNMKFFAEVSHHVISGDHHPSPIVNDAWLDFLPKAHKWRNIILESAVGRAYIHYRIICDKGMGGDTCSVPTTCPANETMIKHGQCINDSLHCDKSYTGKFCEQALCSQGCHYGTGKCVAPNVCRCASGWQDSKCTSCLKDPYCVQSNIICRAGSICTCKYGWTGSRCHLNAFMCMGDQGRRWCNNHGTCHFPIENRFDGPNRPNHCRCDDGYTGRFCEIEAHACLPSHYPYCRNGGTCVRTYGLQAECICPSGFVGRNCEINLARCSSNPCVSAENCTDTDYDYICNCKKGWKGKNCDIDIKECPGQCANQATCIEGVGNYQCECKHGWEGKYCDIKTDICASSPCKNGVCVNKSWGGYQCVCDKKYTGLHCENFICTNFNHLPVCHDNIDNCSSKNCSGHGTCIDGLSTHKCVCDESHYGEECEHKIDFCVRSPCQNGGKCISGSNTYRCECSAGFEGYNCQSRKDACENINCLNGGLCENLNFRYRCNCVDAFWGKHCEFGPNICRLNPCENNGTCFSSPRNYTCSCKTGYTGRDCHLHDASFCSRDPCGPRGKCINKKDGFECKCYRGYRGQHCQLRDYCVNWPCYNGGKCQHDGDNDFVCLCPHGYYGKTCDSAEDSCFRAISRLDKPNVTRLVPQHLCTKNGICMSITRDKYICKCMQGWMGDRCEIEEDFCVDHECKNDATCISGSKTYECSCKSGYTGRYCEHRINKCVGVTCQNGGVCKSITNDYVCQCKSGWRGKHCSSYNACEGTPCKNGGTCLAEGNTFRCECPTEYEGETCAVLASPCRPHTCQNGGTCITSKTTFMECICKNGYTGMYCETNINDCASNPCLNGGKCTDHAGWYDCQCKKGFFGVNCQYELNECLSSPCRNGGECINEIGDYRCDCDPGYTGKNCSEIKSYEKCMLVSGEVRYHGDSWREECNECLCVDGHVDCTNVTCGSENCLESKNDTCTCIRVDVECITPPCRPWGECAPIATAVVNSACSLSTKAEDLSFYCAHLNIHFNKSFLPQGVTLREICNAYKHTHKLKYLGNSDRIEIDCAYEETNSTQQKIILSVFNANSSASEVAKILAKTPQNEVYDKSNVLHRLKDATIFTELNRAVIYHRLKVVKDSSERYWLIAIFATVILLVVVIFAVCFIKRRRQDTTDNTKPVEHRKNDLRSGKTKEDAKINSKKSNFKVSQTIDDYSPTTSMPPILEWERDNSIYHRNRCSTNSSSTTSKPSLSSSFSSNVSELVKRLPKPGTSPPKHSPILT